MKAYLTKAADWFNGLIARERWLILVAAAVLLALLLDSLLLAPIGNTIQQKQATLNTATEMLASTKSQLALLQGNTANSPLAGKSAQQAALQKQTSSLQTRLDALSGGLIKAQSLPNALEELLQEAGHLQLEQMITEPPTPAISGLYKHSVTVVLSGRFTDVLHYLKALENLNWNFYWEALNYNVQEYPEATVELKVYTLSTDAESL